jgi:hypothetical protein
MYIIHNIDSTLKLIQSDLIRDHTDRLFIVNKLQSYILMMKENIMRYSIETNNQSNLDIMINDLNIVTCILHGIQNNTIDLTNQSWKARFWIKKATRSY